MREEVRCRRGASRGRVSLLPRLARWAGVGVFILGAMMACDDGGTGPTPPDPNPNEPYPVWVSYYVKKEWEKFDRNGNSLAYVTPKPPCWLEGMNPDNGDIWASDGDDNLYVFDRTGKYKREVGNFEDPTSVAFDTKRDVVWIADGSGEEGSILTKCNYDGEVLKKVEAPEYMAEIKVYEETGDIWGVGWGGVYEKRTLYKFNREGEYLFYVRGLAINYDYLFREFFIDQTDGSIWIRASDPNPVRCMVKINASGKRIDTLYVYGKIWDINAETGDLLVVDYAEGQRGYALRLYTRGKQCLWQIGPGPNTFVVNAIITGADGGVWFVNPLTPNDLLMSKVTRTGEYLFKDIRFSDTNKFYLHGGDAPYPYNSN